MQDFTGGGINALPPSRPTPSAIATIDERIRALVRDSGCEKSCDLIEEMIITALKMGRDQMTTADLKLFNRSLKELRYAARVFAPYRASAQGRRLRLRPHRPGRSPSRWPPRSSPAACASSIT